MDKDAWNRKHGRSTILAVYKFGKRNVFRLDLMSPERVSVGEEGEGHFMLMDQTQKRRGNQQWRVWCEESGKAIHCSSMSNITIHKLCCV